MVATTKTINDLTEVVSIQFTPDDYFLFWDSTTGTTKKCPVSLLDTNYVLENTVSSPAVTLPTLPDISAGSVTKIVKLTQAEYDDIVTPDATTVYVIV